MKLVFEAIRFPSEEYEAEVRLRDEVLRKPLGLAFRPEELALEKENFHFGVHNDRRLIATLQFAPLSPTELKMRQVAVAPDLQGRGVGRFLVDKAEDFARNKGYETISLHAREGAIPFYLSLHYSLIGDPFFEVGLPHRKMFKVISKPD